MAVIDTKSSRHVALIERRWKGLRGSGCNLEVVDVKITQKRYQKLQERRRLAGMSAGNAKDTVDDVLDALGIEIEEPTLLERILPDVSNGGWSGCCGHSASEGKWYIHNKENDGPLAEVYNLHDRNLMAKAKDMAEWMAKMLLWLTTDGRSMTTLTAGGLQEEGKAILEAAGVEIVGGLSIGRSDK